MELLRTSRRPLAFLVFWVISTYCSGAFSQLSPAPPALRSGDVRLVNGSSPYDGRLEVFYGGSFGTVCDDRFTDAAARVVCRQLGLSGGSALCCGAFGPGSGAPMLLDEVACAGNETRLEQCRHNGWGQHDCEPAEAVGVRCSSEPAASPPPVTTAPDGVVARNLSVAPPVQCIFLPDGVTIGAGSCNINAAIEYYGNPGTFTVATYRVVYVYADGSHSCPAQLNGAVNASSGGPAILILLSHAQQQQQQQQDGGDSGAAAEVQQRRVMIQRRGHTSTIKGVGPTWLSNTWMDVWSQKEDTSSPTVFTADWKLWYDATEGTLHPAGPQVAGWRWKYGSLGFTDGYLPSIYPELTANANANANASADAPNGIATTYQLVYHLKYDYYSFPSPSRFAVTHASAGTPLRLYVQLASTVHPADMVAILLQRVEGEAVWTVARLAADAEEVLSGQRGLVFTDATSRATWGCPGEESPQPPAEEPQSTPPPPSPALPEPPSAATPPVASSAPSVSCRLVLLGAGNGAATNNSIFDIASLECWDHTSGNSSAPPATVEVGRRLAQQLNYTGVHVAPLPGANVTNGSSGGAQDAQQQEQHWGLTFVGVRLTLVDSIVANVPLSPYGPLVRCRDCEEVLLSNVTFRDLGPPLLSVQSSNADAGNASMGLHGALAANGVRSASLADFKCSGVRGANGWACSLFEFESLPRATLRAELTRCTLEDNAVTPLAADATSNATSTELLRAALERVDLTGAGAVVFLASGDGGASGNGSTSGSALSIQIADSKLTSNGAGMGAALFSNVPTENLTVTNSSLANNQAALRGGAVYLGANVTRLTVQQGSTVDNNTAGILGGAFYVAGSVGSFVIQDGSSVSGNAATSGGGGLAADLSVGSITVVNGSSADRNSALGDPDPEGSSGGFVLANSVDRRLPDGTTYLSGRGVGTTFTVSGGSSVSGNAARYGGAVWLYWLRSLVVSDFSRVEGNQAEAFAGVVQMERIYTDEFTDLRPSEVTVTGFSSVSNNYAWTVGAIWIPDTLTSFMVTNFSRFDGNRAAGSPAGIYCMAFGNITVSSNSSISHNEAASVYYSGGGTLKAGSVGNLVIEGGSRILGNIFHGGTGAALTTVDTMQSLIIRGPGTLVSGNSNGVGDGGFASAGYLSLLEISNGASVVGNSAPGGSGGAVAITNSIDSIYINGGVLSNNSAAADGGAIYVGQDVTADVLVTGGSVVEGNVATKRNGGFLYVGSMVQGSVQITNRSRVCSCSAGLSGGGIYVHESVSIAVDIDGGATVCDNAAAAGDGGAAYIGFGTDLLQVRGGASLKGNSAPAGSGGAAYVGRLLGSAKVTDAAVEDNQAGADGGALYADVINYLTLERAGANDNAAGGDGGFACATRITNLLLASSEASGNRAGRSGGLAATLTPPDSVAIATSRLSGNTAQRGAGGVLSVAVPQPGSPLLTQVAAAAAGRVLFSVTDGSVLEANGAYLDGGALAIAAEVASDPAGAQANAPNIDLTVNISGSRFVSNYAGGAGGALSLYSPASSALAAFVSVSDASFTGNMAGSDVFRLGSSRASGWGGAISVVSTPKFRADAVMAAARARAREPDSTAAVGAVAATTLNTSVSLDSACAMQLDRSVFAENRCKGSGGAVAAVSCPAVISGCTFTTNVAGFSGGAVAGMVEAVFLDDIASSEPQDAATSGATDAAVAGGGLRRRWLQQASGNTAVASDTDGGQDGRGAQAWWLDVANSTFGANVALFDCGGGLYTEAAQGAGSRVVGSTFRDNIASDFHGGGVCVVSTRNGAQAVLSGGNRLVNNSASRQGGGIYAALDSGAGNVVVLEEALLSGNAAAEGGAAFITAAAGSRAELAGVAAEGNAAKTDGGALYAQCGSGGSVTSVCGSESVLTLQGVDLTANTASEGRGGGLYVGAGAPATVRDSSLSGNTAGAAGGGIAAVGCSSLTVVGGSVAGGSASLQGGGIFTRSCSRVLLQGLALTGNRAATGGGAFFAGPSDDNTTLVAAATADPAARPAVMLLGSTVASNAANASDGMASSGSSAASYRRFGGHGGGLFAYGNVSVLVSESDLAANNTALVGAAVGSAQRCANPEAGSAALDAVAALGSDATEARWSVLTAPSGGNASCWPLLLKQVQLPSKEVLPVWMQDPYAGALQARCSQQQQQPAASPASCGGAVTPELNRTCGLLKMLAACTAAADEEETQLQGQAAAGLRLAGALLDVAPTHMRPEAFPGSLRPGTSVSLSVRLYNGLLQPVQRDTLSFTVTVSIEPANHPDASSSLAAAAAEPGGGSAHLRADPQAPWQDASIAYLDPGSAAGGSLTVPVVNGLASWPYLTARGWPGRYVLVFTATSSQDSGLYQVAPLRLEAELLPCQQGEALDLTWSQQPGARPSWLACERCGRGRFTLWRDERPALWDINATDYRQYIKDTATAAAEGDASCLPCPSHATCLGGAVLLPDAGYWHSAPDSALFHRCPKEEACGKDAEDEAWASMPDVYPTDLEVGLTPNGAVVLLNASSNATVAVSSDVAGAVAAAAAEPVQALQGSLALAPDTRGGWLALCQQMGYQAMSAAGGNASLSGAALGAEGISSLADLVTACTAWGEAAAAAAAADGSGDGGNGAAPYLQLECATGYTGRLCAACMPGYYVNSEFECQTCPRMGVNITLAILAFLGGVALVLYTSLTNLKENYGVDEPNAIAGGDAAEETPPSEFLKVAIVHAQYYIIITRLPVAFPDVISRLQAAVGAITGAESTVSFSYSCLRPGQLSGGQAQAQLLGALLVPCVVILTSVAIWAIRYHLLNRARMVRSSNLRGRKAMSWGSRRATIEAQAAAALESASAAGSEAGGADGEGASDPESDAAVPGQSGAAGEARPEGNAALPAAAAAAVAVSARRHRLAVAAGNGSGGSAHAGNHADADLPATPRSPSAKPWPPSKLLAGVRSTGSGKDTSSPRARAAIARVREGLEQSKLNMVLRRLDESMGLPQQLAVMLMVAFFILYPGWAQAALSVFACYHVDDGTSGPFAERQQATWPYGYWIRDMTQECYAGIHRRVYLPIGIVAVLLVCLGPPLTSFAVLWFHRKRLDRPSVQQRYGFLYSRYKPRFFWWESVLMLEELGMVAVEVFGRSLPIVSHQVLLMLAAFIVISVLNMACAPVRSRAIVLLEFLSMGVLSLTITLSLYFVVSENLGTHAAVIVGLIILVINVGLLAGFLGLVLRRKWDAMSARGATLLGGLRRQVPTWPAKKRPRRGGVAAAVVTPTAAPPPPPAAEAAEAKGVSEAGKVWGLPGRQVAGAGAGAPAYPFIQGGGGAGSGGGSGPQTPSAVRREAGLLEEPEEGGQQEQHRHHQEELQREPGDETAMSASWDAPGPPTIPAARMPEAEGGAEQQERPSAGADGRSSAAAEFQERSSTVQITLEH